MIGASSVRTRSVIEVSSHRSLQQENIVFIAALQLYYSIVILLSLDWKVSLVHFGVQKALLVWLKIYVVVCVIQKSCLHSFIYVIYWLILPSFLSHSRIDFVCGCLWEHLRSLFTFGVWWRAQWGQINEQKKSYVQVYYSINLTQNPPQYFA